MKSMQIDSSFTTSQSGVSKQHEPIRGQSPELVHCGDCSAYFLTNQLVDGVASKLEAIVTGSKGAVRYLSGVADVTLLKGEANVNGFHLKVGVKVRINHPVWTPAARLHFGGPSKKSQPTVRMTLERLNVFDEQSRLQGDTADALSPTATKPCSCAVLVQGIPQEQQDWLLAAEDKSKYITYIDNLENGSAIGTSAKYTHLVVSDEESGGGRSQEPGGGRSHEPGGGRSHEHEYKYEQKLLVPALNTKLSLCDESVLSVGSAAVSGSGGLLRRLAVDPLHIPPQWVKETETISKRMHRPSSSSTSSSTASAGTGTGAATQYPRVVICGAKGVGKSTCLKYTINRLLSKSDSVCVIDCDLGQPEFTIPGLLSLHLITDPVLSPSHLHLQQPLLSHFIGDITSKNEPEAFARALGSLFKRYEQLRMEYQQRGLDRRGFNAFHLLEDDGDMESDPLPLVVNTDGNIRYMGAEIMSIVLQTVNPTHIFHLSTAKDKDLPAVQEYLATKAEVAAKGEKMDSTINEDKIGEEERCEVCTLEPGRLTASNVHAIDLRNLRSVSQSVSVTSPCFYDGTLNCFALVVMLIMVAVNLRVLTIHPLNNLTFFSIYFHSESSRTS
jgi:hypothetical protein